MEHAARPIFVGVLESKKPRRSFADYRQYVQRHWQELTPRYGGQYVVVANDRIIACGKTQLAAYQKATPHLTSRCEAGIFYIPLPEETVTALGAA